MVVGGDVFGGIRSARSAEKDELDVVDDEDELWNGIDRLPDCILVSDIFCRLTTVKDVAKAGCVCKRWKSILSGSEFWLLWHGRPMYTELWFTIQDPEFDPDDATINGSLTSAESICVSTLYSSWPSPDSSWEFTAHLSSDWPHSFYQLEMASSHGLLCLADFKNPVDLLDIVVGNPRTGRFKTLPAPPLPPDFQIECPFSGKFLNHDLIQQKYKIFLRLGSDINTLLFDSWSMAWHPIPRAHMQLERLFDGSVTLIDYYLVLDGKNDEIRITVYDSSSQSWDRIGISLHPNPRASSVAAAGNRNYYCRYVPVPTVSISTSCKDQFCRLIGVEEKGEKVVCMSLWQLDQNCQELFSLVSTYEDSWRPSCSESSGRSSGSAGDDEFEGGSSNLNNSRDDHEDSTHNNFNVDNNNPYADNALDHNGRVQPLHHHEDDQPDDDVDDDYYNKNSAYIIRSDHNVFIALVSHPYSPNFKWSLVVYDVQRAKWKVTHPCPSYQGRHWSAYLNNVRFAMDLSLWSTP